MKIFLRICWGITHFCKSKNKDFRISSWFSDIFSKNAQSSLKSSNFVLKKCYRPQNNPQKNHQKGHAWHQFLRCFRAEIPGGPLLNQKNADSFRVKDTFCFLSPYLNQNNKSEGLFLLRFWNVLVLVLVLTFASISID